MDALLAQPAVDAYRDLAGHYDLLTHHYRHDRWLAEIERIAVDLGLRGRRVLDVACGTGKSFLPLLERGYDVRACDVSPEMSAIARAAAGGEVEVSVADMRDLPELGRFDLVTCLDDAVNYLTDDGDLDRALASMARALAPGGLLVFDVNTLRTYRTSYRSAFVVEGAGAYVCWNGRGTAVDGDGAMRASASVDVFARQGDAWARSTSEHHQRHWTSAQVHGALAAAGLRCLAALGQRVGVQIDDRVDEEAHTKALYFAARGDRTLNPTEEGPAMRIQEP